PRSKTVVEIGSVQARIGNMALSLRFAALALRNVLTNSPIATVDKITTVSVPPRGLTRIKSEEAKPVSRSASFMLKLNPASSDRKVIAIFNRNHVPVKGLYIPACLSMQLICNGTINSSNLYEE